MATQKAVMLRNDELRTYAEREGPSRAVNSVGHRSVIIDFPSPGPDRQIIATNIGDLVGNDAADAFGGCFSPCYERYLAERVVISKKKWCIRFGVC